MDDYKEYEMKYRGRHFRMAVSDPLDVVQKHHVSGMFYELEELEYLRTLIPPRAVVADVGANVGNHAIYFSQICRAARVTAFEVNESAIALLRRNVRLRNLCKRSPI